MSCYFLAEIDRHDLGLYRKYEEGFDAIFAKYAGEVVAVDDHPIFLEGTDTRGRIVLIRFPSVAEARRWYDSPEYQELARYRREASAADIVLVRGRR
jgi:uncharacterized protein (DUF1330 family)